MLEPTDKKYNSYKITERFLFAMDKIIGDRSKGKITAKMFGISIGIASSNLLRIRQHPTEYFVTIEAIGRLCHLYKVNPNWLILGIGQPYINEKSTNLDKRVDTIEKELKAIKNLLK